MIYKLYILTVPVPISISPCIGRVRARNFQTHQCRHVVFSFIQSDLQRCICRVMKTPVGVRGPLAQIWRTETQSLLAESNPLTTRSPCPFATIPPVQMHSKWLIGAKSFHLEPGLHLSHLLPGPGYCTVGGVEGAPPIRVVDGGALRWRIVGRVGDRLLRGLH